MHHLRIDSTDPTNVHVEVDGQDLTSAVQGIELVMRPGELPQAVLFVPALGDFAGIAAVDMVHEIPDDAAIAAALDRLLSGVDAPALGQEALDSIGYGDGDPWTRFVDLLRKKVADGAA